MSKRIAVALALLNTIALTGCNAGLANRAPIAPEAQTAAAAPAHDYSLMATGSSATPITATPTHIVIDPLPFHHDGWEIRTPHAFLLVYHDTIRTPYASPAVPAGLPTAAKSLVPVGGYWVTVNLAANSEPILERLLADAGKHVMVDGFLFGHAVSVSNITLLPIMVDPPVKPVPVTTVPKPASN